MEGQGQASTSTPTQTTAEAADQQQQQFGAQTSAETKAQGDAVKAAAEIAKRKFKIDDAEVDEDEVLKVYKERKGHQRAANKELQEGKAAKKQAEEFIQMMKDKGRLIDVLYKLGYKKEDIRGMSEEFLTGVLQEEMLDPRERELKEAKAQLKKYEELEKKQKEERETQAREAMKKKYSEEYSSQFIEALKQVGVPGTKQTVAEMAKYIHRAAKLNFELSAVEAAKLVKEDMESTYRTLYGQADPETLVKLLGEENLQKIRGHDTQRIKDPNAFLKKLGASEQGEVERKVDKSKRMTPEQWRAYNRK